MFFSRQKSPRCLPGGGGYCMVLCSTVSSSIGISLRLGYYSFQFNWYFPTLGIYPATRGISLSSREISRYSPLYYSYCIALHKLGKNLPTMITEEEERRISAATTISTSPLPLEGTMVHQPSISIAALSRPPISRRR